MKKRSHKNKLSIDVCQSIESHSSESEGLPSNQHMKNPAAVALGRLGGLKGGKARANALSKERRQEIAAKAAAVRWNKQSDGQNGEESTR